MRGFEVLTMVSFHDSSSAPKDPVAICLGHTNSQFLLYLLAFQHAMLPGEPLVGKSRCSALLFCSQDISPCFLGGNVTHSTERKVVCYWCGCATKYKLLKDGFLGLWKV